MEKVYKEIGQILHEIKRSEEFIEITCNYAPKYDGWNVSGYSGYDASRLSKIEETEQGKKLQKLLDKLN